MIEVPAAFFDRYKASRTPLPAVVETRGSNVVIDDADPALIEMIAAAMQWADMGEDAAKEFLRAVDWN